MHKELYMQNLLHFIEEKYWVPVKPDVLLLDELHQHIPHKQTHLLHEIVKNTMNIGAIVKKIPLGMEQDSETHQGIGYAIFENIFPLAEIEAQSITTGKSIILANRYFTHHSIRLEYDGQKNLTLGKNKWIFPIRRRSFEELKVTETTYPNGILLDPHARHSILTSEEYTTLLSWLGPFAQQAYEKRVQKMNKFGELPYRVANEKVIQENSL